jgi:hypothetical protein
LAGGAFSIDPARVTFAATSPQRRVLTDALLPIAPALILTLSLLLPPEFRITIGGQTLYSYRLAGFALLPWVMLRMLDGSYRPTWPDAAIFAGCVWMVISFLGYYGAERGLPSGTALALDGLLAYAIARVSFSKIEGFRRYLIVIAPVVLVFAALLVVEAVTHTPFVRNAARALFSPLSAAELGTANDLALFQDQRFGLLRANGPFAHPILAGVFFASLLPLYWGARLRSWPLIAGMAAGALSVFSLSSAAFLSVMMIAGLCFYDRLQRRIEALNWALFMLGSGVILALVQAVSQNGIIPIIIRHTLSPQTGYYRLLIWEYASKSVAEYPLFGIGFTPYERPFWMSESIDAFWLALAVRHGVVTPICFLIAGLTIMIMLARAAAKAEGNARQSYVGLAITIFVLVLVGCTVSFFGAIASWFFLILGMATSLAVAGGARR